MAVTHDLFGACAVFWDTKEIGYSENGVQLRTDPRYADIFSDEYGGTEGVPSDTQFLGATGTITMEMTHYNLVNTRLLSTYLPGTTANITRGVLGSIGGLVKQDSRDGVLLLTTSTAGDGTAIEGDMIFGSAFLRGAQEVNKGTIYSKYIVSWEVWIVSTSGNVLFTVQPAP